CPDGRQQLAQAREARSRALLGGGVRRHEGLARADEAGCRSRAPGSLLEVGEGQRGLPRAPRRVGARRGNRGAPYRGPPFLFQTALSRNPVNLSSRPFVSRPGGHQRRIAMTRRASVVIAVT